MAIKNLIQNQSISFDDHDAGSGQSSKYGRGLHLHKKMNSSKHYGGAHIKLYLDRDDIEFVKIKGDSSKIETQLRNEIRNSLKKNKSLSNQLINEVYIQIKKYNSNFTAQDQYETLMAGANRIAKSFDLHESTTRTMLYTMGEKLVELATIHQDQDGKSYYILQNVLEKYISVSDDLGKLLNGKIHIK